MDEIKGFKDKQSWQPGQPLRKDAEDPRKSPWPMLALIGASLALGASFCSEPASENLFRTPVEKEEAKPS